MASEFKLPTLGENTSQGTVGKILISKGDTVSENQPVVEIETDKAVAEIPSSVNGTVLEIKLKEGQTVKVGQVIFTYKESAGAKAEPAKEEAPKAAPKAEQPAQRREPPKLQVLERPAAAAPAGKTASAPAAASSTQPAHARSGPAAASPSLRRMARELGVDINNIPTVDPGGRVTADDIQRAAQGGDASKGTASPAPAAASNSDATAMNASASAEATGEAYHDMQADKWGPVAVEPMNNIRKKTAEFMTQCWTTIPHVTHFEKADITELESLRQKYSKKAQTGSAKLTVTAFLLKIAAEALKRFPKFNSSLDLENDQVLLKQYYNIGVAAETEHGLLVPVIRDVEQKTVLQLAAELPALAEKARNRKLSLDEMQGGTFTISNLGGLGGVGFTPIISAPQVAILGVSRSALEPVYVNGQFAPRLMLPLSLSYDHRVIDGADAARFLRWFCEALEQPWMLMLEK